MRRTRIAACAALLTLGAATSASAQQPAPDKAPANQPAPADLEKAKEHFARGKELFDRKDFANAVEQFKESYRLSKNPLLLYNVGFTLDELGQRALALFYYQKFVAAVPAENPNVGPAKERIEVLQKDIEDASLSGVPTGTGTTGTGATGTGTGTTGTGATGTGTTVTTGTGGQDATRPVTRFEHTVIESAPPGKPIDVGAFVPTSGSQVALFFRAAGEAKFASVDMKARYNERVGRIPADKTGAPTVQYYIEVRDDNGRIVERSGKSTSPNLIFIEKAALPHYYADLGDDKSYHEETEVSGGGQFYGSLRGNEGSSGSGWFDTESSKFRYLKWGTTGAAVGFLALSGTFYLVASGAASSLEEEAAASQSEACPDGPPCRSFSGKQQDLEGRGDRFETFTNVALGVGAISAVAAGVVWYLELKDRGKRSPRARAAPSGDDAPLTAAPVVGPDYVGGAALLRF